MFWVEGTVGGKALGSGSERSGGRDRDVDGHTADGTAPPPTERSLRARDSALCR